jgi:hypothetical protein
MPFSNQNESHTISTTWVWTVLAVVIDCIDQRDMYVKIAPVADRTDLVAVVVVYIGCLYMALIGFGGRKWLLKAERGTNSSHPIYHKDVWSEGLNKRMLLSFRSPGDTICCCHSITIGGLSIEAHQIGKNEFSYTPKYMRSQREGQIYQDMV